MTGRRKKISVFVGTRPELIKLAPVILALKQVDPAEVEVETVFTGQHEELVAQAAEVFGITPDHRLRVRRDGQSLAALSARLLFAIDDLLARRRPDLVVIQGDTTTVLCTALAAFYQRIAIAHVEAGLRTHDLAEPFPEEANRMLVGRLATLNFAPTGLAREALLEEGVPDDRIVVTGNPVIDALRHVLRIQPVPVPLSRFGIEEAGGPLILATMHRRESWDHGIGEACRALRILAACRPDLRIVLPVHPGPVVQARVHAELDGLAGVTLLPPLDYASFIALARQARLILTDSGGLQEEGAALHKPVLVLRNKTERMEAVEAGTARLVGISSDDIVRAVLKLLDDAAAYARMAKAPNPFGDGKAAGRIVRRIRQWLRTGGSGGATDDAPLPAAAAAVLAAGEHGRCSS